MYCEKVSAKPVIGRAMIQARVLSQNGSALVTMSRHHAARDDGIGLGEDRAAGQQLVLRRQAALRRRSRSGAPPSVKPHPHWQHVLQPEQRDALDLRGRRCRTRSRGRCRSASREGRQDARLVVVAHGDDEGKAELRLVGVVELGEARALGVGQRVEPGAGLLGGRLRASAAWPRPACRRDRGGPSARRAARSRSRRGRRAQARCAGRRRCRAPGRAPASQARSAIHGECSKMPPKRATKASSVHRARAARPRPVAGCVARQWRAMSTRRGDPDLLVRLDVVEEARQRRGAAGPADQAAVQADRHHLRRRPPRPRRRACRSCPSGR